MVIGIFPIFPWISPNMGRIHVQTAGPHLGFCDLWGWRFGIMLTSFRDYMLIILRQFEDCSPILGSFGDRLGIILGTFCGAFGNALGLFWVLGWFWDGFGVVLGWFRDRLRSFWDNFGIALGSIGIMLGSFWDRFGIALESFWHRFGIAMEGLAKGPNNFGQTKSSWPHGPYECSQIVFFCFQGPLWA